MAIIHPLLGLGFFPGIIKHSKPSFSKREGKVDREGGFKIQTSIIHGAAYSKLHIHPNIRLVWRTLEKEESKEYKQNGQSATRKYRSIIPNPEVNQYMLTTTTSGVRGILIPSIHLGDQIPQALAVKVNLSLVLLAELQSKN